MYLYEVNLEKEKRGMDGEKTIHLQALRDIFLEALFYSAYAVPFCSNISIWLHNPHFIISDIINKFCFEPYPWL